MFTDQGPLRIVMGGLFASLFASLFAGMVLAADPPPKAPEPVKPITPSESISADSAVPFPVDI